jgi:hypothetical protein
MGLALPKLPAPMSTLLCREFPCYSVNIMDEADFYHIVPVRKAIKNF